MQNGLVTAIVTDGGREIMTALERAENFPSVDLEQQTIVCGNQTSHSVDPVRRMRLVTAGTRSR